MMKYFYTVWLAAMLSLVTAETRGRYVPVEEQEDQDHRSLQSNNNRVLGIAYECDDGDFPLELPKVRRYQPDDVIKICIKPEIRTEKRGVVMRYVDFFAFMGEGSGLGQGIVDWKKEFYGTLHLCIPGQLVCSFKTQLREELFWGLEGDEVNITGSGLVTMEYIDQSFALGGLADTEIPVDLTFLVKRVAPPPGAVLGVPGGDAGRKQCTPYWWCQYPDWFKILMIILCLIFLCCCCAMCLTIPCMIREMLEDDREREERRQFVKEQRMREQRGDYDYPDEQYDQDPYAQQQQQQTYRDYGYADEQDDYEEPAPKQQHRSYAPEPAYDEPEQPRQQSSYRVPRAENSSFRAQQRGEKRYEY